MLNQNIYKLKQPGVSFENIDILFTLYVCPAFDFCVNLDRFMLGIKGVGFDANIF